MTAHDDQERPEAEEASGTPGQQPEKDVGTEAEEFLKEQTAKEATPANSHQDTAENTEEKTAPQSEESAEEIIGRLGDELARAQADIYNLNNEYKNYVRRSKQDAAAQRKIGQEEVMEALLSVLDDIAAAREHGDLTEGPFASIANKLEETLGTSYGLERYGEVGDKFDPNIHDALMANDSADVTEPTIAQVLQPGYRAGEKVLRPTKVMVSNPA